MDIRSTKTLHEKPRVIVTRSWCDCILTYHIRSGIVFLDPVFPVNPESIDRPSRYSPLCTPIVVLGSYRSTVRFDRITFSAYVIRRIHCLLVVIRFSLLS